MNQGKSKKEKGKEKSERLLLFAFFLFLFALSVRLVGLRWGLPNAEHWGSYHPDERQTVAAVFRMVNEGGFNPHFFNYPSLYLYLVYAAHLVAGILGLTHAITPDNAAWAFSHDVILAGRIATAVLGAATAVAVFGLGREVGGKTSGPGLLAGTLMALMPGHVQHSHFATVDVPATFFVALSLWLAVRAARPPEGIQGGEYATGAAANALANGARHRRKWLLWSAFAAGLATATKYNAGLVLVAPLTALFFLSGQISSGRWKTVALLVGAATLGFLLGCPYSALSFAEFWGDGQNNGFAYELFVHPREGSGEVFLQTGRFGWWHHLAFNLPFAMTAPLLVLALLGVSGFLASWLGKWFFARGGVHFVPRHRAGHIIAIALPLIIFVLFYFFALGFSHVRFLRYVLPLLPALCVLAASGILTSFVILLFSGALSNSIPLDASNTKQQAWAERTGHRAWRLQLAITWAFYVLLFLATCDVLYPFTQPDPRDQAVAWMKVNAPAGSTVGLTTDRPWFSTPPFSPRDAPPGSGVSPEAALAAGTRYQLSLLALDAQKLSDAKPQYVVMSEFEWRDKERLGDAGFRAFMQQLNALYTLQQAFKNRSPLALPGRAFAPHDFLYPNPEVRIYRRRAG